MADEERLRREPSVWKAILTDVHFWIPAVVLAGGLLVLHWIR